MTSLGKWAIFASTMIISACGSNSGISKNSVDTVAIDNSTEITRSNAKTVLAAVEPFEALAETAIVAPPAQLDHSIAAVETAVRSVEAMIPAEVASRLRADVAKIAAARKSNQRIDLATASIEGFRDVVGAIPGKIVVPKDVSLLDYSGIRYDNDVQAMPPRWDDMLQAIAYGRERTIALSSLPSAGKLLSEVDKAFAQMEKAVRMRDVKAARAAAKMELDLVDKLELAFAPPH